MANHKSCFINFIGLSNWELDQLVCMCHALACNKINYDQFTLWFISAKPNTWWLDHGGNLSPMAWPTLISWIFSFKTRLKIAGINNLINWLHYNFISYWIGKQQKEKAFLIQLLKNRKLDIKMILFFFCSHLIARHSHAKVLRNPMTCDSKCDQYNNKILHNRHQFDNYITTIGFIWVIWNHRMDQPCFSVFWADINVSSFLSKFSVVWN